MREYTNGGECLQISKMNCNRCGKKIKVHNGIVMEGVFSVDYPWGFFSEKDGEIHSIDICEKCYNLLMKEMLIPVQISDNNELL